MAPAFGVLQSHLFMQKYTLLSCYDRQPAFLQEGETILKYRTDDFTRADCACEKQCLGQRQMIA
jgi:hypothetical protein